MYFARGIARLRLALRKDGGGGSAVRNRVFGDQPSRRRVILSGCAKRRHCGLPLVIGRGGAKRSPLLHKPPPLLE